MLSSLLMIMFHYLFTFIYNVCGVVFPLFIPNSNSHCSNLVLEEQFFDAFFQALKDAWELACSFSPRPRIVIPAGRTFLIHPIDIAGPCRSKITLQVLSDCQIVQIPVYNQIRQK